MSIWKRLQGETPKFFKRVMALSITLAAVGAAVLTAPQLIEGFILGETITRYCQWAIVAGIAAGAVSKTTMQK